jgi:hypothetical protein
MLERYAIRPQPEDDLEPARARWRSLTGEEPGEDVYILGTGFTYDEVVLPRQTLLEIIQGLKKLRAEFPDPPPSPWLFRASLYDFAPAEGEKQLLCKFEERAAMFKEFLRQEKTSPWRDTFWAVARFVSRRIV